MTQANPAPRGFVQLVKASAQDFSQDQCGLRAAALCYAGMLVLFGAEFTQQFAASRGHTIAPKRGAIVIERTKPITP